MVKRVSLADVARAAGVAKATASRALSGRDDVGAATRARILDIAADMGYHPHRVAQALRTGRVGILAVSVPLDDPATAGVLRVVALRAADHGYQVLIDTERRGAETVAADRFQATTVDGVLLVGAAAALPVPCVVVEYGDDLEQAVIAGVDDLVAHIDGTGARVTDRRSVVPAS
ncbi:MAG: LacI family DNA-binding transcriptional regulator [Nocardioides sp.]|uniref:LacI family DNA-binding transcriptional regulator n=1 Tax=Nocardioides sp. TaxID=35761 RepID=UPI0039E2EB35